MSWTISTWLVLIKDYICIWRQIQYGRPRFWEPKAINNISASSVHFHETLLLAALVSTCQPPYIPEIDIIPSPFMVHFMNRREDLISTEEPSTKITYISYISDKICILLCRSSPLRGREGGRGHTETKTLCQREMLDTCTKSHISRRRHSPHVLPPSCIV